MQKWEYLVLAHQWDKDRQYYYWNNDETDKRTIDEVLNELGKDGWELVDTRTVVSSGFYHFKRPLE